ncbi:hypothetical protein FRC17_006726, partial [Serendipita sp. 399]
MTTPQNAKTADVGRSLKASATEDKVAKAKLPSIGSFFLYNQYTVFFFLSSYLFLSSIPETKTMIPATLVFGALALLQTLLYTPSVVNASSINRRDPILPFLDYEGISIAATEAVQDDVIMRRDVSPHERREASFSQTCREIKKRKEWRQLTKAQKKDYMRAIKCLQTKWDYGISPVSNTYGIPLPISFSIGAVVADVLITASSTPSRRFTKLTGRTSISTHMWFVWIHAEAMSKECGYTGPTPSAFFFCWPAAFTELDISRYWNYTIDYKNPFASPIFATDETGFGSHGRQKLNTSGLVGFKVDNGAFANFKVNLPAPHYLMRNFSAWKDVDKTGEWGYALGESFGPNQVRTALAANKFIDFEAVIDGYYQTGNLGLHNGPHFFNMGDWNGPGWLLGTPWYPQGSTAPNDPIFWNHHAYVDAIFWQWQQRPGKQWLFNGNKYFWNTTEDSALPTDLLPFYGLGPNVPVALT